MRWIAIRVGLVVQVLLLFVSYGIYRALHLGRRRDIDWVVGPNETAALVYNISRALPSAYSVALRPHPFYSVPYDLEPKLSRLPRLNTLWSVILGPIKLGGLACRAKGFIYVGAGGFLIHHRDQRNFEFRFLKKRGCAIVCYFTGNDIRSPQKMKEMEERTGMPNIGTYLAETDRRYAAPEFERLQRRVAAVADRYADVIFNADVDQRSHLARETFPFMYFLPDEEVTRSFRKFTSLRRPIIVHAPSSPIIKGTPLVRAAIAQLGEEGYDFEYIELIRVPHEKVKAALQRAHISLNEFYSSVPGVFGVESMAAGCALLTSADEEIEPQLPKGGNQAWMVTPHYRIAENLRVLLDHPERMEPLARAGAAWVREYVVASRSGAELRRILDEVLTERRDR